MDLPKNERRTAESVTKRKLWIYGQPFSGKTTVADKFPDTLMLNSDGNVKYVTAPYLIITDKVEVNGRITKTKMAWEVFKEVIDELAKKQNTYKTIVVDLLEDMYEHCRKYIYAEMGVAHESDGGYGKGWDMVKTEFLSTMKKLVNLDYDNIILISQETISEDITKRSGDKITAIKPNIPDKTALKIAGMVDVVMRAVVVDGEYKLTFKTDEVEFGGGRIKLAVKEIPNNYDALIALLNESEGASTTATTTDEAPKPKTRGKKKEEPKPEEPKEEPKEEEQKEAPVSIPTKDKIAEEEPKQEAPAEEAPKQEEAPRRRTRRTRE